MASDSFEWVWTLIDRVSGPGRKKADTFGHMERNVKKAADAHGGFLRGLLEFEGVNAIFEGVKTAVEGGSEAVTCQHETMMCLKIFTKSGEEAEEAYTWLTGFAGKAGFAA